MNSISVFQIILKHLLFLVLHSTGAVLLISKILQKHKQMFMRRKKKQEVTEDVFENKPIEEIDEHLKRLLLETTGDDAKTREKILGMPKEIKLQMIENAQRRQKSEQTVESYFEIFETEHIPDQKTFDSLFQSLQKNSFAWMKMFVDQRGVDCLVRFSSLLSSSEENGRVQKLSLILEMFEVVLVESSKKKQLEAKTKKMILERLCWFTMFEAIQIASKALSIVSSFVVDIETSQAILDILQSTQKKKGAAYIFEGLCKVRTDLKGFESYLVAFLSFFNKLIFFQEDVVSRFYYRTDFLRSGFEEIKKKIVETDSSRVKACVEVFEQEMNRDEAFVSSHVEGKLNEKNSSEVFELVQRKFKNDKAERFLTSILSLLLFLPEGKTIREMCFKLIEKRVLETVFEGKKTERSYEDFSMTLVDIRVAELLNREHELKIACSEKDEKIRSLEHVLKEMQRKEEDKKQEKIKKEIKTVPIQQQHVTEKNKEVKTEPVKETKKNKAPPPPPLKKPPLKKKETGLKRIMWNSIPFSKTRETVWADVEWKVWSEKINKEKLSLCFKTSPKEKISPKKTEKKTFIDGKNGRVIEIAFQGHKITIKSFIEALESFSLGSESLCVVDSLSKVFLSKEKLKELGKSDEQKLNFPDRLFYFLSFIPFYEVKLKVVSMSRKTQDLFYSIEKTLRIYSAALKRTKYSKHLKVFLALLLCAGNHLNGTTGASFVSGVKIEILTQLSCIKGTDQSLLDFLVSAFEEEYSDADLLREDLEIMSMGSKFSFDSIRCDIDERLKELNMLSADVLSNTNIEQLVVDEVIGIERRLKALKKDIEEALKESKALSLYFANEKENNLFAVISDFRKSFMQSKFTVQTKISNKTPSSTEENMKKLIDSLKEKSS